MQGPRLTTRVQIGIDVMWEYILRAFEFKGVVRALIDIKDVAYSPVEG